MSLILLFDDEKRYVASYLDALSEAGFEVEFRRDVDAAARFLNDHPEVAVFVLDVMAPAGDLLTGEDTQGGIRTGLRFYEWVRARRPSLPVIVLTNVRDDRVEDYFSCEPNCRFLLKQSTRKQDLVREVCDSLAPTSTGPLESSK
jgi:CheY-like chemotaxis protein